MTKFNFEKLRKHTEYTLTYELTDPVTNDTVDFEIIPTMSDRTNFLEMVSNKKLKPAEIVEWFTELTFRADEEKPNLEDLQTFKDFALAHYGDIHTQTMIGFKLTTQDKIDEKMAQVEEKVLEKNL
jgi:hypothetical protein